MRELVVVCVVASCAIGACKAKPRTDDRPEADNPTLYEEQKRIARGEVVGEPLRSPKIVVDALQITINGHRVGPRSDLSNAALKKSDSVFQWAKGLREHWKMIHPGQNFESTTDVTVPADFGFYEGASLAQTLAFAGYPFAMKMRAGDQTLTFDGFVPGPPDPEEKKPGKILELCHSGGWHARYAYERGAAPIPSLGAPWGRDDAPGIGRAPAGPASAWRPVTPADVGNAVNELCVGTCERAEIGVEAAPPTWHETVRMIAAVHPGDRRLPVRFAACTLAVPDAGAPEPAPHEKQAKLRAGAVSVSGTLPREVVQRVVRASFEKFRSCYDKAAAKNPNLTGRVSIKFTIDEQGIVSNASSAGSDLPDAGVVACVAQAFQTLSFPKPDQGSVTVVYPLMFEPG